MEQLFMNMVVTSDPIKNRGLFTLSYDSINLFTLIKI